MSSDIRRGALSLTLSRAATQLLSAAVIVVLARVLSPHDFAIFAIAYLFVNFLELMSDGGLSHAIVQIKELTKEISDGIFWLSLIIGCVQFCIAIILAGYAENFFAKPGLAEIIRWLSVVLIINSLFIVPYMSLERQMNMKARAQIDIYARGTGMAASCVAAIIGAGIWSFVFGQILSASIKLFFSYKKSTYRPAFVELNNISPQLLGFGLKLVGLRLAWWINGRIDKLIAGKFLGTSDFGHYSFAFQLTASVQDVIRLVVGSISFPVLSREQGDTAAFNAKLLRIYRYAALVTVPVFLMGVILAEPLIITIFSEKWQSSIVIFQVFCVVQMLWAFTSIAEDAFVAQGKPAFPVKMNIIQLLVLGLAFSAGIMHGIPGMLVVWLSVFPLLFALWIFLLLKMQKIPFRDYARAIAPAVMGAVGIGIVASVWMLIAGEGGLMGAETFLGRMGFLIFYVIAFAAAYALSIIIWGVMTGESIWKELRGQ
jgi:PST family polysaccharide transporter